jgi:putative addiction module component (TIGR02574 family)
MSLPDDHLTKEALTLPSSERAKLASALIASLDHEPSDDPAELERAWEQEIERRVAEYRSGRAHPIAASEVFAEARQLCEQSGHGLSTDPVRYEPALVDTSDIALLLDELCTDLGFCLPTAERARIQARPIGVDSFVEAVLLAEDLDPELLHRGLRRQIRERFLARLGEDH